MNCTYLTQSLRTAIISYCMIFSLLVPCFTLKAQQPKALTIEDIWGNNLFYARTVRGLQSMKDGLHYTAYTKTGVVKYDYKEGKEQQTLFLFSELAYEGKNIIVDDYSFSANEQQVLIASESEPIYRHSKRANYFIWDMAKKKLIPLSLNGKQQFATFSPDGKYVAFVRDNNIFLTTISTKEETQITHDGKRNAIINGWCDWVYEEEFSFARAFEWNVDGTRLAYYKFDESRVKEFTMDMYGSLYPERYTFKYPKAGEDNSIVSIHTYSLADKKTTTVDVGKETDQYIPRILWTKDPLRLSVQRMNRLQNKLELLLADAQTGASQVILAEQSPTYIDIEDHLVFLKDRKTFIWSSGKDGNRHLYHYSLEGKEIRQITKGNWEVIVFHGMDESTNTLFYTSTEVATSDRHLYSIRLNGTGKKLLTPEKGSHKPIFSEGNKYFIDTYSDANTPYRVILHLADGKQVRVLETNEPLIKRLQEYNLGKKEFFTLTTTEGIALPAWRILPPEFDSLKKNFYPVLMLVYGGPGHATVNNAWEGNDFMWQRLMASKGYIVISVDNRGTPCRGEQFKKCAYKQMGKLETIDQIGVAQYMGSLPYVNKSRIGIEGWSYGGYLTSLCMTKGADYFKLGVAVAPVTNWRYYDNIYTERFLQKPQDNPSGYDENSPINFVKQLKGKYLLIHGSADDNVHMQNTMEMADALIKINKPFDLLIYPNKNHSIYGGNTRLHLYSKITNYILENL